MLGVCRGSAGGSRLEPLKGRYAPPQQVRDWPLKEEKLGNPYHCWQHSCLKIERDGDKEWVV